VPKQNVLNFFQACADDENVLQRFNRKSLPELMLHARSMGFDFTQDDLTSVIGAMEVYVITERMGEEINASSSLWAKMWGKPHMQYVIDELYRSFSEDERARFAQ
jgi:Nif11 domain